MADGKSNYHEGSKNAECYFCGSGPPLHEHHVIPQRFDGPDTKDNIVELCGSCHKKIERLYDKSFYEWFGIEDEKGERTYHRQCENTDCKNKAKVKIENRSWEIRRKVEIALDIERIPLQLSKHLREGGFRCRPCAAKLSRNIADVIQKEYSSQLEDFYDTLEMIHDSARGHQESDHMYGSSKHAKRLGKDLNKPQEPNLDAESILDEIVIEEAEE